MDELALMQDATQAVEASTGLRITLLPMPTGPERYRPDALVYVESPGGSAEFVAEHKSRIAGEAQLSLIREHLAALEGNTRPLLLTHHLTDRQIDHCHEIDLDFMDAAGNCLLRASPLWVSVRGNRPPKTSTMPTPFKGGTSYASLRVIYALLCRPELLTAPYREIATSSGVSLGVIPPIFTDLEQRELISPRDRDKRRHLLAVDRLQNEWVTNYPNKLRPRLKQRRFTSPTPDWWREADIGPNGLWGSEVAAYRLNGYLKPATQTIYLSHDDAGDPMTQLLRNHRLRADPHGQIEIIERFWHFDDTYEHTQQVVNPLLVYADLLNLKDSRANEASALIRKEYLHA
jgi:hypothetical protein